MLELLRGRLLQLPVTLLLISIVVFVAVRATGSPVTAYLPPDAGEQQRQRLIEQLGLELPLPVQYVRFVGAAIKGDFGTSLRYRRPALEVIREHIPLTATLTLVAMTVATVLGILIGTAAAARPHGLVDTLVLNLSGVVQSLPTFWIGMMLILLMGVRWHILPTTGGPSVRELILPTITLSSFLVPPIILLTRSSILDVLGSQYITVARSKGLTNPRVLFRHALKNALIPVIGLIGVELGSLLGGAVIVETVFSMPGLGYLTVQAVYYRDMPIVQAAVFIIAVGVIFVSILVDWITSLVDPRIST